MWVCTYWSHMSSSPLGATSYLILAQALISLFPFSAEPKRRLFPPPLVASHGFRKSSSLLDFYCVNASL